MIRTIDDIADFAQRLGYENVPVDVAETVADAITDATGFDIAGSRRRIAVIRSALDIEAGAGGPTLIGFVGRCSAHSIADYNEVVIHPLEFDYTNHHANAHPSSHLLPVLLDAAGRAGLDGKRAISAHATGLEIEVRLGATLNRGHYLHGWHTTAAFGAIGAATTASWHNHSNAAETRTPLAIDASKASRILPEQSDVLSSPLDSTTKPTRRSL